MLPPLSKLGGWLRGGYSTHEAPGRAAARSPRRTKQCAGRPRHPPASSAGKLSGTSQGSQIIGWLEVHMQQPAPQLARSGGSLRAALKRQRHMARVPMDLIQASTALSSARRCATAAPAMGTPAGAALQAMWLQLRAMRDTLHRGRACIMWTAGSVTTAEAQRDHAAMQTTSCGHAFGDSCQAARRTNHTAPPPARA
jgi:hypothetical protein